MKQMEIKCVLKFVRCQNNNTPMIRECGAHKLFIQIKTISILVTLSLTKYIAQNKHNVKQWKYNHCNMCTFVSFWFW